MTPLEKLHCATTLRKTGPDPYLFPSPKRKERTASCSVRELPDGKLLIHDFGGDDVATVLAGLGLEVHDPFPELLTQTDKPRRRSMISAADALRIIASEAHLIAIAAANVAHGVRLSPDDRARVLKAAGRTQAILQEFSQ